MEHQPLIGFLTAGAEDRDEAREALAWLGQWGIVTESAVISGRLHPARVMRWAGEAEDRGLQALIVLATNEPALAELTASCTILPVISATPVPPSRNGSRLPPVIQAAGPMEAALIGLQIAARASAPACEALAAYRDRLADDWDRQFPDPTRKGAPPRPAEQRDDLPPVPAQQQRENPRTEFTPSPVLGAPPPRTPDQIRAAAGGAPFISTRRSAHSNRLKIESDILPMESVMRAVEVLSGGGIIALPTDTVYGVAVDAANPQAVERLNRLKDRPSDKALAIFIDSTRLLGSVAQGVGAEVRGLLEAFWPGPLTVVFERRATGLDHLAEGRTIGVRIPDHNVPLTLTQELRRPIACTSANPSGMPEARSADEVEDYFGREIDLILDAGRLPPGPPSTVIDVTRTPFRILREGAISRSQLAAVSGDFTSTEG